MTVNASENKAEPILEQPKVEEKIQQQKTELKQEEPKQAEKTDEDPNWRAFREARKKDRAEREAAERKAAEKEAEVAALKAAMEAAFAKSNPLNPQQQYYPDPNQYPAEETEEEKIDKRVNAIIAAREAEAEKQRLIREQQEYPQRLAQSYPDLNQTISQENLDYLDYHYPEVSRPLQRLPDGFDKWSDIYKAVKKFVPNNTSAKKEAAKAEANFNKPKSMSSSSITQPGEAIGSARLTDEKRAANWERMQKILKGVS